MDELIELQDMANGSDDDLWDAAGYGCWRAGHTGVLSQPTKNAC